MFLYKKEPALQTLCANKQRYKLIVMDPPWSNKSANRNKKQHSYETSHHNLLHHLKSQLPMQQEFVDLQHGTLVAVWVTNRTKYVQFVEQELFAEWNVQHVTRWYWVKVCSSGEVLVPFDDKHRKPYEMLILGWMAPKQNVNAQLCDAWKQILQPRVFFAMPSGIHSQKPSIRM